MSIINVIVIAKGNSNYYHILILFFVVSEIGLIKRGSSLFCKEMNLKIEPPPYEQILWKYTNKTLGQLV